jgi:DNA repair protein RadC
MKSGKQSGRSTRQRLLTPDDVGKALRRYSSKRQEHFLVLTVLGDSLVKLHVATVGLANYTIVHAREVFCWAIADNATAIIVAHNHPSGILEPSKEDDKVTEYLLASSKILGIRLLDHLIVHGDELYSYRAQKRIIGEKQEEASEEDEMARGITARARSSCHG